MKPIQNGEKFYFSDDSQFKIEEYEKDFYEKINKILFLDKSPKIEKESSTNDISKIKNQSIQSINIDFKSLLNDVEIETNLFQKEEKDNKNKITVIESINNNKKNEKKPNSLHNLLDDDKERKFKTYTSGKSKKSKNDKNSFTDISKNFRKFKNYFNDLRIAYKDEFQKLEIGKGKNIFTLKKKDARKKVKKRR